MKDDKPHKKIIALGDDAWEKRHPELKELAVKPQREHGEHNFTVRSDTGAVIEVQLANRVFYVKAVAKGSWKASPTVRWAEKGSTRQTWLWLKGVTGF